MDQYGVNPRLGKARMHGDGSSFFIEDGQHRVAWHYVNRQMFVPVRVFWDRKLLSYGAESSFTDKEQRILREKYEEIRSGCRNYLVAILDDGIVEILSDCIRGQGQIEPYTEREIVRGSTLDGNIGCPRHLRRILAKTNTKKFHLYRITPKKYELFIRNGKLMCDFVDKLLNELKKESEEGFWGYISPTITEGFDLEAWF